MTTRLHSIADRAVGRPASVGEGRRRRQAIDGGRGEEREPSEVVPGEGAVGRALVVAQRVADQLIAEAEQAARQIRERAQQDADRIRGAAATETEDLERRRREVEAQLHDLDAWVTQRRDALRQVLSEGLGTLEEWLDGGPSAANGRNRG